MSEINLQEQESVEVREKPKNKTPLIIILLVVFVVLASVLTWFIIDKKQEKERIAYLDRLEEYHNDMNSVRMEIIDGAALGEEMMNEFANVWSTAIYDDMVMIDGEYYFDFNEAIFAQQEVFEENGKMGEIETNVAAVDVLMDDLNNPPAEFEDEYQLILDMYLIYNEFVNLAMSPEGSLNDFNDERDTLTDELLRNFDELEVKVEYVFDREAFEKKLN